MPNPEGKNGYKDQTIPSDEVLTEALTKYATRSYSRDQKLQCLRDDLGYTIKKRTLNKLELRLCIGSVRKPPPIEVSRQAVIDEVSRDTLQLNGPAYFQLQLKRRGLMIPRDTIRGIMHDHFDAGFTLRFPGHKKNLIPRVGLSAMGPYHEISADGHEKLSAQALQMGELGLPIYAYKDKWSDYLLLLRLIPVRLPSALAPHPKFSDGCSGIPLQVTTDKGSEIGWQYAFQSTLREAFAPDIDALVYAVYMVLKNKDGLEFESNHYPRPLFYWIFVPLIQHELDEFRAWWNQHRVRLQWDKNMPSAHVPAHVFEHPSHVGGIDCRIRIPKEAVSELRGYLTEEVGSRESHLGWPGITADFETMAQAAWVDVEKPEMSLESAWDIFAKMSPVIENY
ncbi:hypothetical protein DFH07DRAFT_774437 [Mycena maculata]|uniref:Uncharacterized protein n=1 Tax=Mycena maculata TaxID=230809 RepID=A0AAD7IXB9_9AGAR|nr:hypothetical protein DFH07DRAFT_774437 [Mycena maculata]